jgi:hypothetical protein
MPDFLGFQYRGILVVFEPEHDFLFKSATTYCALKEILEDASISTADSNDSKRKKF